MIKHIRHGTFSLFEGFERAEEAEGLVAETREVREHHQVLTIAVNSGCSAYDSEFVALALETGLPLLTYDRKLIDAFPGIAITPGDWLKLTED
jgi:predicted nucleic acid-binding protein